MDEQLILTVLAIFLAGGFVAWRGWRAWGGMKNGGCGGGCCSKAAEVKKRPDLIASEEITLRQRPGRSS